jgi:PAS domain S-box-containing protein
VSFKDHRALFESAPDGILVVDASGRIADANPEAERLFGYKREELDGQPVEMLIPHEARDRHVGHRERYGDDAVRRPMGVGLELRALRKDGTEFPVEISLNGVTSEGVRYTIATIRNVSQRRRLRDFGAGALRAAEDVRTVIARELHDETAQEISAHLIQLRLYHLSSSAEDREEIYQALRVGLQETAEGVRRIARGLRPPELEDAGLWAALRSHARQLRESRGMDVELKVDSVERYLTPDGLLVLYRIVQEALTNAARHGNAPTATVTISYTDGFIDARVEDTGRGFSPDRVMVSGRGLGLMGMQERAVMVGGRLQVESRPGEGTRVAVRIPAEFDQEVERV